MKVVFENQSKLEVKSIIKFEVVTFEVMRAVTTNCTSILAGLIVNSPSGQLTKLVQSPLVESINTQIVKIITDSGFMSTTRSYHYNEMIK